MTQALNTYQWDHLLPARRIAVDLTNILRVHAHRTILITGAGGSIGSALSKLLATAKPLLLLLLDHSADRLKHLDAEVGGIQCAPHISIQGDAGDPALLERIFIKYSPTIVYHAAAFKDVPRMEADPFAAIKNNAIGTWELARGANHHRISHLILISTDKAANARSIMGASKYLAELAILRWSSGQTSCSALRLGNVLGSHGSVLPLFLDQIECGGPLTVTHKDATRYFLTMSEAVNLILGMATLEGSNGVFLPEMGQQIRIVDLARQLAQQASGSLGKQIDIQFTALRPGDKLHEDLLSRDESVLATANAALKKIVGPQRNLSVIDQAFRDLPSHVESGNLPALLDIICSLIPDYQPSAALLNLISPGPVAHARA
jgi:FlaA1/EpsC-like NDP-sugar epimerase